MEANFTRLKHELAKVIEGDPATFYILSATSYMEKGNWMRSDGE